MPRPSERRPPEAAPQAEPSSPAGPAVGRGAKGAPGDQPAGPPDASRTSSARTAAAARPEERPDPRSGLGREEVAGRVAAGLVNAVPTEPTRTVAQILRANVFTRFNALLGSLFLAIVIVGPLQDALFGGVLVLNTAIGLFQEIRAKLTLDRLAVMSAPRATVVREGTAQQVGLEEIVLDDVLEVGSGDQVLVDAVVIDGNAEVDESLLSGEADPVPKAPGDELLSGSFVVAGRGLCRAVRVGSGSYAQELTAEARRFSMVHSELQSGTNLILRAITWAMVPVASLLVASQLTTTGSGFADAVRGTVAGVGSMVPEGLVLLTSVAFAVAVVRLAGRRVLVQELASVEVLARVDVVCLDKTGTLTQGGISFHALELLDPSLPAAEALAALAAADPNPNASLRAVAAEFASEGDWLPEEATPFSSARKWGGASFSRRGTWILGAPEVVVPSDQGTLALAEERAGEGNRVLLLAHSPSPLGGGKPVLPAPLAAVAFVILTEEMRPDVSETVRYFIEQGVTLKVISGDHPLTVAALARRAGVPGAEDGVDSRGLPDDAEGMAEALARNAVFGRVTPHQKRAMVAALQAEGHVVAMTGDGVNDVLALKDADIGIAMGSGSSASRAVSQLVLLGNAFDVVPGVVAEGRRVIANVERVANLFVTKTVYATLIGLVIGATFVPYPFYPRHLTVISTLTIGTPALILSLAPNAARYRPGFVRRTLQFTVPAGVIASAVTLGCYALARSQQGVGLEQARTAAVIGLFVVATWILLVLMRPYTWWKILLAAAMVAAFVGTLVIPPLSSFLALSPPAAPVLGGTVAIGVAGAILVEAAQPLTRWLEDRSAARSSLRSG